MNCYHGPSNGGSGWTFCHSFHQLVQQIGLECGGFGLFPQVDEAVGIGGQIIEFARVCCDRAR